MQQEFAREVLARLPLAAAVLTVWRWVVDPLFLLSLFARQRGAAYEKVLSFAPLAQLMADARLEHRGSGRKSFTRAQENGQLEVSVQAVYQKLGRGPLGLSEAWLAESTERVRPVYPGAARVPVPSSLQAFAVMVVDGKTIKRVAKRLKPLQGRKGGVLGGKRWRPWNWRAALPWRWPPMPTARRTRPSWCQLCCLRCVHGSRVHGCG